MPIIENPNSVLNDKSDDEFETMLNSLALALIDLSKSREFREKVHKLVKQKFDGDDNTLIKHLNQHDPNFDLANELFRSKSNRDLKRKFRDSNMKSKYDFSSFTAIEKFNKIVDGYTSGKYKWYPQIFIPYVDVSLSKTSNIPTIAIVKDDEPVIPGYFLDNNDNVIMIDVNHEYAKKNLTWIVSVNERIDDNGILINNKIQSDDIQLEQRMSSSIRMKLSKVKLYSPHESWGRSEVSQVSMHGLAGSCFHNGSFFLGEKFVETNRMNHLFELGISDGLTFLTTGTFSGLHLLNIGECYDFVLFERDPARASTENLAKFRGCENGSTMQFFSYSGPYFQAFFVNDNIKFPMCLTATNSIPSSWVVLKTFDVAGEAFCELIGAGIP